MKTTLKLTTIALIAAFGVLGLTASKTERTQVASAGVVSADKGDIGDGTVVIVKKS